MNKIKKISVAIGCLSCTCGMLMLGGCQKETEEEAFKRQVQEAKEKQEMMDEELGLIDRERAQEIWNEEVDKYTEDERIREEVKKKNAASFAHRTEEEARADMQQFIETDILIAQQKIDMGVGE